MDSFLLQSTLDQGNVSWCQRLQVHYSNCSGTQESVTRDQRMLPLSHCLGDQHPRVILKQNKFTSAVDR